MKKKKEKEAATDFLRATHLIHSRLGENFYVKLKS